MITTVASASFTALCDIQYKTQNRWSDIYSAKLFFFQDVKCSPNNIAMMCMPQFGFLRMNELYRYCPCLRDRTANQISGYSGRNNLDYLYLCDMAKKSNTSLAYETLLNIILPDGILEIFEVSNVREEHTGIIEETGLELRIIHIHLDERDLRVKEWHDLRPNGFTEEHCINDFPIRDRKVVLHVRRRRWKDEDGKNVVLPHESLTAPGTSYSKEFADVLKKIFGCLPDTGPLSGAVL